MLAAVIDDSSSRKLSNLEFPNEDNIKSTQNYVNSLQATQRRKQPVTHDDTIAKYLYKKDILKNRILVRPFDGQVDHYLI